MASAKPLTSSAQAGGEKQNSLQYQASPIHLLTASRDGSLLATLDDQHRLRLWQGPQPKLLQDHSTDHIQTLDLQRVERDTERQTKRIDRWNANLVELQAIVEKESKSIEAAKQALETAKKEWDSKQQELQTITQATTMVK